MSKKAEGFSLRFVLINTGNISRKVLSKVLRSFVKNFERLHKENVYMLSMIDEDDLAEFVTETKKQETEQPTVITPQPETKPAVEETEKEPEKESKETNTGALLAIALLAVAGCGGVYYFKVVKPKKEEEDAGDEDLEFYEGDYINEDSENHMDEDDTEE